MPAKSTTPKTSKRAVKPDKETRKFGPVAVRGFAAAQTDRLLAGWQWDGGFSAQEIRTQLAKIRARSREMAKNNPHMRRFLQLIAVNVVGEGFTLKSTPHDGTPGSKGWRLDKGAARFIEYHFWRWATGRDPVTGRTYCDASGVKTLAEINQLNAKTWARDGEYFILPVKANHQYGFALRVIRPDACDETYFREATKNQNPIYCGREIDRETGAPIAYYFHTTDVQSGIRNTHGQPLVRIPASMVIHGFTQEDEDQPRGIPWGHAALVKLKMIDEFDKAEITAARDEACSVRQYHAPSDDPEGFVDLTSSEYSQIAGALVAEKEAGQSEILPPGWKSEVNTPQHPNREVSAFKATMIKDVASGFGVEYSNFANDWSGVSFSSVRAGTISERDTWVMLQGQMIAQSQTPIFLMWIKSFLSSPVSGEYPESKIAKFSEHEIRGRRWMWVDPQRDMNAAKLAVENGWKTNTDVASDLGYDYQDNLETIAAEKDARAELGIAEQSIAGINPVPITGEKDED